MKNQKVIVVESKNCPPTAELEEALAKFGDDWKIKSASTTMAPWGGFGDDAHHIDIVEGSAKHLYYATTVVLERVTP